MTKRKRCDSPEAMFVECGESSGRRPRTDCDCSRVHRIRRGLPHNGCDNSRVQRIRLGLHLEMVLEEDRDGRG